MMVMTGMMLAFVVFSSYAGIITNYVAKSGRRREYLGFLYALNASTLMSNITLLWIWLKKEKLTLSSAAVLAVINFFLFPMTVPFAEDGLYLGYGINRIKNDKLAVIVPAFFFAVQHCFIPVFFDVKYILYRFFAFLPLTLVLCWHYRKHGNPLPIMIAHGLIDMSMSVMVLVMSLSPALYESMINA